MQNPWWRWLWILKSFIKQISNQRIWWEPFSLIGLQVTVVIEKSKSEEDLDHEKLESLENEKKKVEQEQKVEEIVEKDEQIVESIKEKPSEGLAAQ